MDPLGASDETCGDSLARPFGSGSGGVSQLNQDGAVGLQWQERLMEEEVGVSVL